MLKILKFIATLFVATLITTPAHAESNKQVICLAQNMYHEARGEGDQGMLAVSNVVINRMKSGKFPTTPCGVITQKTHKVCQFSWVCQRNKQIREPALYQRALQLARQVYSSNMRDITRGALYYRAKFDKPRVNRSNLIVMIGSHNFYRG